MNNEDGYDDYNVFIIDCARQLKETRFCYCYNLALIIGIKDLFLCYKSIL